MCLDEVRIRHLVGHPELLTLRDVLRGTHNHHIAEEGAMRIASAGMIDVRRMRPNTAQDPVMRLFIVDQHVC